MAFTNDKRAELIKRINYNNSMTLKKEDLLEILARLDTAETTIVDLLLICDSAENKEAILEAMEPWHKSRGK